LETKYLLAFNAHEKIGSQTLRKALAIFDNKPEKIWQARQIEIEKKLGAKMSQLILEARNQFDPEEELKKLEKIDAAYITIFDKYYPKLLAEIPDAPVVLYVRGNMEALSEGGIAIVGSRRYTQYGRSVAYRIAQKCAEAGVNVFSGLAHGIDATAHKGALDGEGITVGVLGCGIDQIYPSSNQQLGKAILQNGGAIISELPCGTLPLKFNFPLRNRIIAGLTSGTLVVEAAETSGALITAYLALDYNRDVYAIPGNIDSPSSRGTNNLIKKGAKLVTSAEDILEDFGLKEKIVQAKSLKVFPETEEEKIIMKILSTGEQLIDEIVIASELNVAEVSTSLMVMEMKGLVINLGGGRFKSVAFEK